MNFYVWWIISIFVCIGMRVQFAFKVIKDIANAGYKFKLENLSKIIKEINPNMRTLNKIKLLIPGFNILDTLILPYQYNQKSAYLIDGLRTLNTIEAMSEEEFKQYQENPKIITALNICINSKNDITNKNVDGQVEQIIQNDENLKGNFSSCIEDEIQPSKNNELRKNLEIKIECLKKQKEKILEMNNNINNSENLSEEDKHKIKKMTK